MFKFAIDRGGTFTDIWAKTPDDKTIVLKLLSEDPANYLDAPREGIRRILEKVHPIFPTCLMLYFVLIYLNTHFGMVKGSARKFRFTWGAC